VISSNKKPSVKVFTGLLSSSTLIISMAGIIIYTDLTPAGKYILNALSVKSVNAWRGERISMAMIGGLDSLITSSFQLINCLSHTAMSGFTFPLGSSNSNSGKIFIPHHKEKELL